MANRSHRRRDAMTVTYFQPAHGPSSYNARREFLGFPQEDVATPGYYVDNDNLATLIRGYMMSEIYYTDDNGNINGYPLSYFAANYFWICEGIVNFTVDIDVGEAGRGDYVQGIYPNFIHSGWNPGDEINIGLAEESITKYLNIRNTGVEDDESAICVVCQDILCQDDHTIATLECGHEYHPHCIKRWLTQKNMCPLCKAVALSCPADR